MKGTVWGGGRGSAFNFFLRHYTKSILNLMFWVCHRVTFPCNL